MTLPVSRFRFFGIRKLNWAVRENTINFSAHLKETGFGEWIDCGPLTIIVGPNGGGKSTVIDLFRSLSEEQCWPGLPRENYPGADFSGFDFEGDTWSLGARFSKFTKVLNDAFDRNTAFIVGSGAGGAVHCELEIPKYKVDGAWRREIAQALRKIIGFPVCHFSSLDVKPAELLDDAALVRSLNELSAHFPSVFANPQLEPFKLFQGPASEEGRIGVLFKDDGGQHAFVDRDLLPQGWLQLASILAFMRTCPPSSLILLDEPDRYLHPSLQRVMLDIVATERRRIGAQLLLATHSSVLLNPELGDQVDARVLVAANGRCQPLTDRRRTLDDLGVTSGDLVQANGLIWVEGPSDRIYIKAWMESYARARGQPAPLERIHYAFVTYGGSLLKHITLADDDPERVSIRSINRNFAVVIDRDIPEGAAGAVSPEKRRLLAEATALGKESTIWITEGYTIENYLPASFDGWLSRDRAGRTKVRGSKVELSRRFGGAKLPWPSSFRPNTDLPLRVERLLLLIERWQTPQEYIEPAFLPPWLSNPSDDDVR